MVGQGDIIRSDNASKRCTGNLCHCVSIVHLVLSNSTGYCKFLCGDIGSQSGGLGQAVLVGMSA